MKNFLLILITAGLILTSSACSCGGNTIETTPQVTESNIDETAENGAVISDDEEDIFGEDSDNSDYDENVDSQSETGSDSDSSTQQNTTATQKTTEAKKTVQITDKTTISAYASYITDGTWTSTSSSDTIVFNDNGSFSGKINGKKYSGTFNMRLKSNGVCALGVTLDGSKNEVEYTASFKTSTKMTLTTNNGESETYVSE